MKGIKQTAKILVSVLFLSLAFFNCEYEAPTSMWNQPKSTTPTPVIESIDPPDSSVGGDIEIRIVGQNFSSNPGENFVYFNRMSTRIINQSEAEITVFRPAQIGENLIISVAVQNAEEIAVFDQSYKITSVFEEYGGFLGEDFLEMITIDGDENLYGGLRDKSVVKISPSEERSDYGTLRFRGNDMKMGPGGYLYAACNRDVIYRIPPGGGDYEEFTEVTEKVKFIDFDENGNIYAGGKETDFFVVKSDGTFKSSSAYDGIDISTVRYYDGFFWIGGSYEEADSVKWGIWRGKYNDDESIGDPELVCNNEQFEGYIGAQFLSITFSSDGEMLIGTDQDDPILLIKSDDRAQPLYYNILESVSNQLIWGAENYLYSFDLEAGNVIRIDMGKPGAPYYGR